MPLGLGKVTENGKNVYKDAIPQTVKTVIPNKQVAVKVLSVQEGKESKDDWVEIQLQDGTTGWVQGMYIAYPIPEP